MPQSSLQPSSQPVRDQLLQTARSQFAEDGFEGVSIASVASAVGVTKQALLHHFGSKARLYGEVLQEISEELASARASDAADDAADDSSDDGGPIEAFQTYLVSLLPETARDLERSRLLVRELLDNHRRASSAKHWYMADFLEDLIWRVGTLPGWRKASRAQALALVYQLLGAIHYYAISGPTLAALFGEADREQIAQNYAPQLNQMIAGAIALGPVQPEPPT